MTFDNRWITNGITGMAEKDVIGRMFHTGEDPTTAVDSIGAWRENNIYFIGYICWSAVEDLLKEKPKLLEEYKNKGDKILGVFIGRAIEYSRKTVDADILEIVIKKFLEWNIWKLKKPEFESEKLLQAFYLLAESITKP